MFEIVMQVLREAANERRRQAAIRELSELNDHLLTDIGLRRDQLPAFMIEPTAESPKALPAAPVFRQELAHCG
jgi:uncharacterized protein YjiS (DUF1127 family)